MTSFVVRRLVGAATVCLAVSILVFVIFIVIPGGNPAQRLAGRNATTANIVAIRHDWGFDRPLYVQYGRMMIKLFDGTLISYSNRENVDSQIAAGLPATISLAVGAAAIWMLLSLTIAIISALTVGRWPDRLLSGLSLVGVSLPIFWLGILSRYYLAEGGLVSILPDGGYTALSAHPFSWLSHLILPWLVLAVAFVGFYGRVLRASMLEMLNADHVRTAQAKGLSPWKVITRHVLRASLIPIVTLFGVDFAAVLGGGAILVETVFGLHGVGQYAAQSISNLDLPPIMAITTYAAFLIVLCNLIVDLLYPLLDPRIRGR